MYSQQRRLDQALLNWLSEHRHSIFLTVTLKKSLVDPHTRTHLPLTDEHVIRTGKFVRNEITRRLVGRHGRLNFATFYEVGLFDQRPHLHILFDNPNDVPFERIKSIVQSVIGENRWAHQQWDVQPIYSQHDLLGYTLKQDLSAYLPEASWRPAGAFLEGH